MARTLPDERDDVAEALERLASLPEATQVAIRWALQVAPRVLLDGPEALRPAAERVDVAQTISDLAAASEAFCEAVEAAACDAFAEFGHDGEASVGVIDRGTGGLEPRRPSVTRGAKRMPAQSERALLRVLGARRPTARCPTGRAPRRRANHRRRGSRRNASRGSPDDDGESDLTARARP